MKIVGSNGQLRKFTFDSCLTIYLQTDVEYHIQAQKFGRIYATNKITIRPNLSGPKEEFINIYLQKIQSVWDLPIIDFNINQSSYATENEESKLLDLANWLKENDGACLTIASYCGYEEKRKKRLSNRRASKIYKALILLGVEAKKMTKTSNGFIPRIIDDRDLIEYSKISFATGKKVTVDYIEALNENQKEELEKFLSCVRFSVIKCTLKN